MTDRVVNVKLLGDVLRFLTDNPHIHSQGTWLQHTFNEAPLELIAPHSDARTPITRLELSCGTAGCLAGWAAVAAGYAPAWSGCADLNDLVGTPSTDYVTPVSVNTMPITDVYNCQTHDDDDPLYSVEEVATSVLGLAMWQATLLFAPDNTLRDLWEYADLITDGVLTVPASLTNASTSVSAHRMEYDREKRDYSDWTTNDRNVN